MTIGVDVSKDNLSVCDPDGKVQTIANSQAQISRLLSSLEPSSTIAMEATGKYHKALADSAYACGFRVIVFNPKDVLHYARSVSPRAKTDKVDAKVIAGYAKVRPDHHLYHPLPETAAKLKDLLGTRVSLVRSSVSLRNRLSEHPESHPFLQTCIDAAKAAVASVDKEVLPIVQKLPQYDLLDAICGFGPVVTPYILAILASGEFRSSDAFVAFIGMDIRVRQSGKHKGKSKLSKRGDPEARRLLYLAASAAIRMDTPYRQLYLAYQSRGMSKIAALNAVARKLARTAWSMYVKNKPYVAERVLSQHVHVVLETTSVSTSNHPHEAVRNDHSADHHPKRDASCISSPPPGDPTYSGRRRAVESNPLQTHLT